MKASIADGILTIQIPVNKTPTTTKSQKSLVVASTRGWHRLDELLVNGKPLSIGLNAIIPV